MFDRTSDIYDILHGEQDHAATARYLDAVIRRERPDAGTLLDVACGTGLVLEHLAPAYTAEGTDIEPGMLAVARRRLPGTPLHEADMVRLDLGRTFDAIVCVGSAIGYARTPDRLAMTLAAFARHLEPGGVALVEGWFPPDVWEEGRVVAGTTRRDGITVSRMIVSGRRGDVSTLDLAYLVGTRNGIEHRTEHHELGLFTGEQMTAAFASAGMTVRHDDGYPSGRGLWVGRLADG